MWVRFVGRYLKKIFFVQKNWESSFCDMPSLRYVWKSVNDDAVKLRRVRRNPTQWK